MYRYVATSVEGFVQQVAVCYVTHGYFFYVAGQIPADKDPERTDRKIIDMYRIDVSKSTRVRQKKAGEANLQYLRFGHSFVILATPGFHHFFEDEASVLKDIRETPLRFWGYEISCHESWKKGKVHPSVRISREQYSKLKDRFIQISAHRTLGQMMAEFRRFPFEPYAPIRSQLYAILKAVNKKRQAAGLEAVPKTALRLLRRTTKCFAEIEAKTDEVERKRVSG